MARLVTAALEEGNNWFARMRSHSKNIITLKIFEYNPLQSVEVQNKETSLIFVAKCFA